MKAAINPTLSGDGKEQLFLSRPDLVELTGSKRVGLMIGWLKSRGWVFEQPSKRGQIPCVSRHYFYQRMGVSFNVTPNLVVAQKVQQKPNLDFLRVKK